VKNFSYALRIIKRENPKDCSNVKSFHFWK
jgi:hypothetical protein